MLVSIKHKAKLLGSNILTGVRNVYDGKIKYNILLSAGTKVITYRVKQAIDGSSEWFDSDSSLPEQLGLGHKNNRSYDNTKDINLENPCWVDSCVDMFEDLPNGFLSNTSEDEPELGQADLVNIISAANHSSSLAAHAESLAIVRSSSSGRLDKFTAALDVINYVGKDKTDKIMYCPHSINASRYLKCSEQMWALYRSCFINYSKNPSNSNDLNWLRTLCTTKGLDPVVSNCGVIFIEEATGKPFIGTVTIGNKTLHSPIYNRLNSSRKEASDEEWYDSLKLESIRQRNELQRGIAMCSDRSRGFTTIPGKYDRPFSYASRRIVSLEAVKAAHMRRNPTLSNELLRNNEELEYSLLHGISRGTTGGKKFMEILPSIDDVGL